MCKTPWLEPRARSYPELQRGPELPIRRIRIAVKSGSEDNNGDNARISEKSNLQEVEQRGRDSVTC